MKDAPQADTRSRLGQKRDAPLRAASLSRAEPFEQVRDRLGNAALARRLRACGAQTRLEVSEPGDANEREADAVAARIVAGGTATLARGRSEQPKIHRQCTACSGGAPCADCQSRSGGGQPLPDAERTFFEPRLARDLSRVRVHTSDDAAAAARALSARAFTVGDDIAFATGAYAPGTDDGRRLLAHELVHVAQQNGGRVHRQPATGSPGSDVVDIGDGPILMNVAGTVADLNPLDLDETGLNEDPCAVDVPSLTNAQLLRQFARARDYMIEHPRMDDFYAHVHLLRRTVDERKRRMYLGEVWLGDDLPTMPSMLFGLVPGPFGDAMVVRVPLVMAFNAAGPSGTTVLTPAQLQRYLEEQNIPQLTVEEYLQRQGDPFGAMEPLSFWPRAEAAPESEPVSVGAEPSALLTLDDEGRPVSPFDPALVSTVTTGAGLYQSPFATYAAPLVAKPVPGPVPPVQRGNWRGFLGEISYGYGSLAGSFPLHDVNTLTNSRNFPILDFRNRVSGNLISVKTSVPANSDMPNIGTYTKGWNDIAGVPRDGGGVATQHATAVQQLNAQGLSLTAAEVIANSFLAVNEDHVPAVRDAVREMIRDELRRLGANATTTYAAMFDAYLGRQPITIGGTEYRTWAQVTAIRTSDPTRFDQIVQQLAARTSDHIIGNGMRTIELRNLQNFRLRYPTVGADEFQRLAAPELIEAERYGGGLGGTAMAVRRAAVRGGAGGLVLGGILGGYSLYKDHDSAADYQRFALNTGWTGVGGAMGGGIETSFNAYMSRVMLARAATGGAIARGIPLATRGLGGGIAGGIVAPLVTMGAMATDPEHTFAGVEYAARAGRAFVAGVPSGILAAATVGAIGGPVGFLIGLAVGFAAYMIIDRVAGDSVEDWIRDTIGEPAGCPR